MNSPEESCPDVLLALRSHVVLNELRKLLKPEAGWVIGQRYVLRIVGLLATFPPNRSHPSDGV
ncbi:hypothetical protein MF271_22495 (plasmid) [Deinococcus sp. KNUC1210]|uniref:hypothetical protein n=1 Tax=Deinococcus sp. KNUC1210 TaxID=2917691 RepID=UPI001EF072F0|nr:hypothetical protein [Deinococcus sp. KNUC1210]ULH18238.1 hypothetical protein MF271_22495 [Deinococcus sp. KNUC1210]